MLLSALDRSKHPALDELADGVCIAMPNNPTSQTLTLDGVDCRLVNGEVAFAPGLNLAEALSREELPERYLDVVAIRTADADQPWLRGFVAANRAPKFKALIAERFQVLALSPDRTAAGPPAGSSSRIAWAEIVGANLDASGASVCANSGQSVMLESGDLELDRTFSHLNAEVRPGADPRQVQIAYVTD